jgi:hypothetical protein
MTSSARLASTRNGIETYTTNLCSRGLVLVPDEDNILRALGEGEVHLELGVSVDPVPTSALYFSGASGHLALGFSRYRVFVYNTTERSASVNVFAYLAN